VLTRRVKRPGVRAGARCRGSPRRDPVHESSIPVANPGMTRARSRTRKRTVDAVLVELDTRYLSQPASGLLAARRDRARAVFGQAMGLVALTVGCLALGAYMGRDLTGGAGIALSVGAVICLVGLNSSRPTGAITRDHARRAGLSSGIGDPVITRGSPMRLHNERP
jgi:hypothetical protein